MSFINKGLESIKRRITGGSIFTDQEVVELVKERNLLLKELSTPAPTVESPEMLDEADIRLPRIPFNQTLYYLMRWQSVILRMICLKLKQEIFRETMKDGFDWEPAFTLKCNSCGGHMDETVEACIYCKKTDLSPPNPTQKQIWDQFILTANKAEQTFLEVCMELEDDLNTVDDLYLICIKDYLISPEGKLTGKVKEVMRGDPTKFRIVADETGRRGGKYWVCAKHRDFAEEGPGECDWVDPQTNESCKLKLYDVHYVETEAGGKNPMKFYIEGEVIHTSKYEPSRLYGISPIFTLWIISRTLQLMDRYTENLYEQGRLKGVLGVSTDNIDYLKKWWSETQDRLRKDPHYMPVVAIESGDKGKGRMEFVKFIDSMKELQASEYKKELRTNIAALYGISPIFQADLSTGGGLQNEGLQITVTDRAVDMGQSIYHNKVFPKLCLMLQITDWKPKLQPSREMDEMAELQREDLKVTIAQKMIELGFEVRLQDEEFIFTGQASRREEGQAHLPSSSPPLQLPERAGRGQPEPDNREGIKNCPPGQIATIENPRCHPIEWEENKAMTKADLDPEFFKRWKEIEREKNEYAKTLAVFDKKKNQLAQQMSQTRDRETKDKILDTMRQLEHEINDIKTKYRRAEQEYQRHEAEYKRRMFTQKAQDPRKIQDEIKRIKAEIRETEMKYWAAGARYGYGSRQEEAFLHRLDDLQVALERLTQELNKATFTTALSSYFNPIYSEELDKAKKIICDKCRKTFSIDTPKTELIQHGKTHDPNYPENKGFMFYVADSISADRVVGKSECRGNPPKTEGFHPYHCEANKTTYEFFVDKGVLYYIGAKTGDYGENDISRKISPNDVKRIFGWSIDLKDGRDKYKSEELKKAVESGKELDQEIDKIETHFVRTLEKTFTEDLVEKIRAILDKGPISRVVLIKLITDVLTKSTPKMEKLAFAEILRAFQEGKDLVSPEGKLEKMSPVIGTQMGKVRSAKALVSVIPEHKIYNEPFMGGANTFLQKEPAQKNYLNDFDEELVKVYEIIRTGSENIYKYLIKRKWSPSPRLFKKLQKQDPKTLSDPARAYRKLYLRRHSFNAAETHFREQARKSGNYAPKWLNSFEKFKEYADLFQKAEFSSGDWKKPTFKADSSETYHFFDPPYNTPKVIKEWSGIMCEELPKIKGKFMLTFAYDEPTIQCLKSKGFQVNIVKYSNLAAKGSDKGTRKEIIATNYKINVPKDTIFKSKTDLLKMEDKAPQFALKEIFDFSKSDQQVLRAIFEKNPFWEAFDKMSQSTSDQLKGIITESYEPVNTARFQATLRDVQEEYRRKGKPISKAQAERIAYGRIGKFSLAQTLEKMVNTIQTELYRLERIARTETTGITAKGREVAMAERDPKNQFRYDWFGPVDHRTSDICKEIEKRVKEAGKGSGVPLNELKEIMKSVVDEYNPKWGHRDWVPHANCRRVLRRVS